MGEACSSQHWLQIQTSFGLLRFPMLRPPALAKPRAPTGCEISELTEK